MEWIIGIIGGIAAIVLINKMFGNDSNSGGSRHTDRNTGRNSSGNNRGRKKYNLPKAE